jgi:uncharacterized SAM-binding protein YcdF (DUF218 family)
VVWFIIAPSHLVLWGALATALLLFLRRDRTARRLAVATVLLFCIFGVLPTGQLMAQQLENQYPRPATLPKVDGILTLGGGLDDQLLQMRHAPASERSEARLVSTFELARRYPSAKVVFSGGWGRYPDAQAAQYAFAQMGFDPARLVLEANSRNTYENLVFTKRLVKPQPGETWVLATSAIQMPRAMAQARRLGWNLVPWPTDYLTPPAMSLRDVFGDFSVSGRLATSDFAAHEWVGLLVYELGSGGHAAAPASKPPT